MALIRLEPPIYMETPLGPGLAHFYNDQLGPANWTVFLATGAIVIFSNEAVRAANSYTEGRWNPDNGKRLAQSADKSDQDMRRITAPLTAKPKIEEAVCDDDDRPEQVG